MGVCWEGAHMGPTSNGQYLICSSENSSAKLQWRRRYRVNSLMRSRTSARILLNLRKPYSQSRSPLESSISTDLFELSPFSSISRRPMSLMAAFIGNNEEKRKSRLSDFYRDVILNEQSSDKYEMGAKGVCENASVIESLKKLEKEVNTNEKIRRIKLLTEKFNYSAQHRSLNHAKKTNKSVSSDPVCENASVVENLKKLDKEVKTNEKIRWIKLLTEKVDHSAQHRSLNHAKKMKKSVSSDPTNTGVEDNVMKELSPDMQIFVEHLYDQGYFNDANFAPATKFDATLFQSSYARGFIKFAAVRFGGDHTKVAEWISASDLKKVVLFGCPSIGRSSVYAAKHIRKYFKIEEDKVCQKCKMNDSCNFATRSGEVDAEGLRLDKVTRVLTSYALGSVPKKLTVPDEINASVGRLLKEIVNLSKLVHETSDGV